MTLFPEQGLTDPHTMIVGDRLYLICGHDAAPANENWDMDEWRIHSTTDLVNWRFETRIRSEDTFMGSKLKCWGSDIAARDGRYYVYFSDGTDGVGVLRADAPGGPYVDVLRRPLVSRAMAPDTQPYDPDLFTDDDGECYLFFGCGKYYVARLAADMVSLAEPPRPVVIDDPRDVSDKACVFKRAGRYYLAWGGHYAMADNVYGPYRRVGPFPNTHANFCTWQGRDLLFVEMKDFGLFYRGCEFRPLYFGEDGLIDWTASGGVETEPPGRSWDFQRSTMGWRAVEGRASSRPLSGSGYDGAWPSTSTLEWVTGGGIRGTGRMESCLFPLANLEVCKRFRIRLKNESAATDAQLQFAVRTEEPCWFFNPAVEWRAENTVSFPIRPHDRQFRDYEVDLSKHPGWRLDLKKLALLPGERWAIERMEIA